MRHLKKFNESIENWSSEYFLKSKLEEIINLLGDKDIFKIKKYVSTKNNRTSFAEVKIFDKIYDIYVIFHFDNKTDLKISDFPINNSPAHLDPGFRGNINEIAELLNDITKNNNDIDMYLNTKKYNL